MSDLEVRAPDTVEVSTSTGYGRSEGRRNEHCGLRDASGRGRANGHSAQTFSLSKWEPVYGVVAEAPDRGPQCRSNFRALAAILLTGGRIGAQAFALHSILLEDSDARARAVDMPVKRMAVLLGCCTTTAKLARNELLAVGLLIRHNRKSRNTYGLLRQRPNRYGFAWTAELADWAGWDDRLARKNLGDPEAVYSASRRDQRRSQARQTAVELGQIQAERAKIKVCVDEIMAEANNARAGVVMIGELLGGDVDALAFGLDYFETSWPRYRAGRRGRELARSGRSEAEVDELLHTEFGSDEMLLDLALAGATFDG